MTDIRFILDTENEVICDDETNEVLVDIYDCCKILNVLHEENVELKEAMKRMMADMMMGGMR